MSELTRHRSIDASEECWHVDYGDVHVGTIAKRVGNPHDTDPWEWSCGFYPGSHPGEHQSETAATLEQARADFEAAWRVFWRNEPRLTFRRGVTSKIGPLEKYAMWEAGEKFPSQTPNSLIRCPCGQVFDSHRLENTLIHVPHITAEHQAREIHRANVVQRS
jgi:hypothetical protein